MYVFIYCSTVGLGQWPARYVQASGRPGTLGPPDERAGPTRFIHVRARFGHVPRHVGQHDPGRSINGLYLAWPYSYRAETGSDRVRAGWPVWTSIATCDILHETSLQHLYNQQPNKHAL
jgi:hypothetical protein